MYGNTYRYNLYTALGDLEQYARKNSPEIHGILDDCYSTTEEVALKLAAVLNVNVNPSYIEHTNPNDLARI